MRVIRSVDFGEEIPPAFFLSSLTDNPDLDSFVPPNPTMATNRATNSNKAGAKNKKRSLASEETTEDNSKRNKDATCPICNNIVRETQQAIFCEGTCKQWMHRQCASLTVDAYAKAGKSQQPFYCLHCTLTSHKQEIDLLTKEVKSLTDKLNSLLPTLAANNTSQNESQVQPSISQPNGKNQSEPVRSDPQSSDRKFNLVIYGINESPSGTKRSDRVKHDVDSSVTILAKINNSINPTSIRDCFRLGKYKQSQGRPRPILLKLNRAMDADTILSNRSSIDDNNITIKRDMSPQDQHKEALLLKERWLLIQSGVSKTDIKIKSSSLYVKGKKYGYVYKSVFNLSPNPSTFTMDTDTAKQNTPSISDTSNSQSNPKTSQTNPQE